MVALVTTDVAVSRVVMSAICSAHGVCQSRLVWVRRPPCTCSCVRDTALLSQHPPTCCHRLCPHMSFDPSNHPTRYEFPKDTKKSLEEGVQKTTDGFVKKLDDMVKAKTDDIMKV